MDPKRLIELPQGHWAAVVASLDLIVQGMHSNTDGIRDRVAEARDQIMEQLHMQIFWDVVMKGQKDGANGKEVSEQGHATNVVS